MIRAGSTCASPNERTPGVSTTQPSAPGSRSAMAEDEVCRPRPVTSLTTPVARPAPGTSALTSVDLPTPECPMKTLTRPASRSCSGSSPCHCPVTGSREVTTWGTSSVA